MSESARVFVQLNAYADVAAAEADQKTVEELHSSDRMGRFETTVIARDDQGQVRVVKGEATARRWASRGLVVGAVLGVMFPPSILLSAGAGAVAGGFGAKDNGLLLKAIPDADLDALGRPPQPRRGRARGRRRGLSPALHRTRRTHAAPDECQDRARHVRRPRERGHDRPQRASR